MYIRKLELSQDRYMRFGNNKFYSKKQKQFFENFDAMHCTQELLLNTKKL